MSQTIIVTGGAGFIGSNLVGYLLDSGCQVIVYDNFSTGRRENLESLPVTEIFEGDISKNFYEDLRALSLKYTGIDGIVHLAAQVSVQKSLENPKLDAEQNYLPIYDLIKFAKKSQKLDSIVFASSAAVYGDVDKFPISESLKCNPLSPYGLHKLMCEKALGSFDKNMSVTALRFFNIYGPKQDPKSPYTGVISTFIDQALSGLPPKVFGTGEQTRDFVYVEDLVEVIFKVLMKKENKFQIMNVGNGVETSILDLAKEICNQIGISEGDIQFGPARNGDIFKSVSCNKVLCKFLPDFKGALLKEGIKNTVLWRKRALQKL